VSVTKRWANTWCYINGVYSDACSIDYTYYPAQGESEDSPAEPAGVELEAVWCEDQGNVLDELTERELCETKERIILENHNE
jgi:hypothetical protein